VEIDVWDGEPPSSSSSSSENEATNTRGTKPKKPKLGIRKRLELRFGRKGSDEKKGSGEKTTEASPPPRIGEERIQPWRSDSYTRAEPRVLHGTFGSSLHCLGKRLGGAKLSDI
jgi:hypothetical protein